MTTREKLLEEMHAGYKALLRSGVSMDEVTWTEFLVSELHAALSSVPDNTSHVIATVEELSDLPVGTAFRDNGGHLCEAVGRVNSPTPKFKAVSVLGLHEMHVAALPATVLTPAVEADTTALAAELRALHVREVVAVHEGYGEEAWCPRCQQHWPCEESVILDRHESKGGAK